MTKSRVAVLTLAVLAAIVAGGANAAVVKVGNLILRADGGFAPNKLPRSSFAPIDFHGYAEIEARDGGVPPVLQRGVIDFDHDGRLDTNGLPTCGVERVATASTAQARRSCPNAIVGSGRVSGVIAPPGEAPQPVSSALTIFNGPRQGGNPTVVLHAQMPAPSSQVIAISVPIERRRGTYGYRATIEVPPIAGGYGVLTRLQAKVGKRYFVAGRERSYVSARCSDGVLQAHGHFSFVGGMVIDGTVFKGCTVRKPGS
ncbi:MAG TPA: hypothetical protein VG518_08520 [Solirubrobacterales bacterium]|nr:hypothetical protein [Solirubrobacterales bacterium]